MVPPNSTQYLWGGLPLMVYAGCDAADMTYSNAQSYHAGGVNIMMSDGSVRFIKSTVSIPTWWALGTLRQRRGA